MMKDLLWKEKRLDYSATATICPLLSSYPPSSATSGTTSSCRYFSPNDDNFDDEDEECSLNNLDACMEELDDNRDELDLDQSLTKFLSMPIVEVQLAILVLLSSLLVGLGTLQELSIPPVVATLTKYGELIISTIFTIEYLIRWKLSQFSFQHVIKPLAIIDLVAILPGLIKMATLMGIMPVVPALTGGALINLRLLRILRLQRVLTDYETFQKFELALGRNPSDARPYQLELARVVISIFTLLSVTSGVIYSVEHAVNPEIPDYFTAFYFGIITLTTVGFGDIHPVTTAGKWVVSGTILVGIVVIPAQTGALVEALMLNRDRGQEEREETDIGADDESVMVRIKSLEQKVDETNARIDRVLEVLELKRESDHTTDRKQ